MKRYTEYKDSGVEWIGEIPRHWKAIQLKRVVNLVNDKTNEQGIPYIALENIESFTGKILSLGGVEPESICNKFKKGDVLFCKLRPYLTKCISPSFDGKCTSELLVLRGFKGVDSFLKYVLLSPKLVMNINASTYGAKMPRASWNYIGICHIPLPPLPEQQAIVTYLDSKVSKIDEFISIAEKKISALEELKQTIIAEAVTKGINKNVTMKDSGVNWIGEIPEHWEVSKIRSLFKLSREKNTNPNATLLSLSQYTGVKPKNECEKTGMFEAESTIGYNVVRKGQFVMNIMLAWNGSYAVSKYDGIISPAYCVFDFIKDCNKDYFDYLLRLKSYSGAFKTLSKGLIDSRLRLYPDYFKTFHIIVPPIEEQKAIVSYIDNKAAKIDQLCQAEQSQIDMLKEYKQRLISDVVTGKVKVIND